MGLNDFYKEISTPKNIPVPNPKPLKERLQDIVNPKPSTGRLVVEGGSISGGSSSRRDRNTASQSVELDEPVAETIQAKAVQGEQLRGSILLKDGQKTAGDIYREYGYDRGGSIYNPAEPQRYNINSRYSPATKTVLAQENIQRIGYEDRTEIANPGSAELRKEKEMLQALKASQTGTSVPGGAQGVFTRASGTFEKVSETVDSSLPNEADFKRFSESKIGRILYGRETPSKGQSFYDVGLERKQVVDVGSYFVPGYGQVKFLSDIGREAESGRWGTAIALASIPYVAKFGGEIPKVVKDYKQYKFIKSMQQKYSGALSTNVNPKDLAKAKELGIVFKGREVKAIKFFTVETPSVGRVSRTQTILGKEQKIPQKSLKEAELYLFKQRGTMGGTYNQNPLNTPAKIGSQQSNLGIQEFTKNTIYSKKAVQNFLEGKLPSGRKIVYDVPNVRFVSGEGTLSGLKFSRETGLTTTTKRIIPKLLERSKPINNMQSRIIIEKGTATKPGSDYLLDRIRNDLLVTIKETKPKQIKIFKVEQVIKPQVQTPGSANVPSGSGTQTIQILKQKAETSSIALNKVRDLTLPKTETRLGQSVFSNMFKKQKPLYKVEPAYVLSEPSKSITGSDVSLKTSGMIGFKVTSKNDQVVSPSFIIQEKTKISPETKITPKIKPETKIIPSFRFGYKYSPLQNYVQRLKTTSNTFKISKTQTIVKVPKLELPKKKTVIVDDELLKSKNIGVGFQAFLKRKGKFVAVSPIVKSKLSALDIGTLRAKQTLGATFKVEQVKGKPLDLKTRGEFSRFQSEFRDYAIRGQKKIKLNDTYIQKSKFRLGTRSEISEIQQAKKTKENQRWF